MADRSVARTTRDRRRRNHRCDADFLNLLREAFGIDLFTLTQAFLGMPAIPKKQAIAVCAWAESKTDDSIERGVLVRRWAKERSVGMYAPEILEAPELTYEHTEHERRVRKEQL